MMYKNLCNISYIISNFLSLSIAGTPNTPMRLHEYYEGKKQYGNTIQNRGIDQYSRILRRTRAEISL